MAQGTKQPLVDSTNEDYIHIDNLYKTYYNHCAALEVLKGVNLSV